MRKLSIYNFITLNGFFKGAQQDINWHKHGAEENEYSEEGANSDSMLLFGRITYQMMAGFWQSPMAFETARVVAEGMNKAEKIVFSTTLEQADWHNTTLVKTDVVEFIRHLKQTPGKDMTVLGSGTIVSQLADAGLIDTYQIMVDPVAIGAGTPIFSGIKRQLDLKLISTRTFRSGVVLLNYEPASVS
jgi:dihydrofolate reductase